MSRPSTFLVLAVAILGGFFFFQNFQVDFKRVAEAVKPRDGNNTKFAKWTNVGPPVTRAADTIRIATFNIQTFGESKLQKPHVMDALARIVRKFDIVAIQEIRAKTQDLLPEFVNLINSTGAQFDFVIGPRLGNSNSKEQYAFIFDRASVEVDRSQLYTVEDPDNLLHREPLVAWFRVRGPKPEDAFTFTLVNVHTDPDVVQAEMNAMDDVFRAVRDDGRGEDDVIMLGDFNADDRHLGPISKLPGITCVISRIPTNTHGNSMLDNMIFDQTATREFAGRSGVFDFLREYNLSLEEALEISDHLPVWAEFSIYEGGVPGRVADLPNQRGR